MAERRKISAIIPCFNEEKHIEAVLRSVRFADEVILVDSFSTDKTLDLAEGLYDKLLQREYENSASQKNWAIPQATHDWILLVDADERVTPELQKEILGILDSDKIQAEAFWIRRANHFLGKRIRYSGWQRDKVIRLFQKKHRYQEKHVHSEVIAEGNIPILKNRLLHYTADSVEKYVKKLDRYAYWSSLDAEKKGVNPNFFHFRVKPAFRFVKQYVFQRGFLDGRAGFIICKLDAYVVFQRYALLWGRKNGKN
jgi:glycosyltransferase involved in cell wall biosynthesis